MKASRSGSGKPTGTERTTRDDVLGSPAVNPDDVRIEACVSQEFVVELLEGVLLGKILLSQLIDLHL